MKYFQIEGTINEEMVSKFMDFCNIYISEDCTIVINSGGGKSTSAAAILNIINYNADKITLVSAGVYSAAFYIFYHAKCKKQIIEGSLGMHHKEYLGNIYISENGKAKYDEDICQIKNLKNERKNFLKDKMTKKELKKYNSLRDVYFTFKRMKQLFPKVEIIK